MPWTSFYSTIVSGSPYITRLLYSQHLYFFWNGCYRGQTCRSIWILVLQLFIPS